MPNEIVHQASGGALNAEHYQTFEMAKENDTILGGDDIAQIRSYANEVRAASNRWLKRLQTVKDLEAFGVSNAEALEQTQILAKVAVYGDMREGELLRELPKSNRWESNSDAQEVDTKASLIQDAGISRSQAYDLQKLAANPDVVQAVIDKATADGTVVSRAQVLKAIRERDQLKEEVEALEKQNDKLFEQVENAQEPQIVEREVVPADYAEAKKRTRELEHLEEVHRNDNKKLREWNQELRDKLERAEGILNLDKTAKDVQNDVQFLVIATNNYVRQYGGLTWTFEQLSEVDTATLNELKKAIKNLATFSSALTASLENINALN